MNGKTNKLLNVVQFSHSSYVEHLVRSRSRIAFQFRLTKNDAASWSSGSVALEGFPRGPIRKTTMGYGSFQKRATG
jgi:hypothetical protein